MQLWRRVLDVLFALLSAFTFVVQFFQGDYLYVALFSAWVLAGLLGWEIIELRDRPRPRIQHMAGESPYVMSGGIMHRVGVKAEGANDAEDVQVRLLSIDPKPGLLVDVLPSKIGHKGGLCSEGCTVCNISSEDEHHFDLLEFSDLLEDGNHTGQRCWRLMTSEYMRQPIDLTPGIDYAFHLRARAKRAISDDRTLRVRRNPDNTLDISLRD